MNGNVGEYLKKNIAVLTIVGFALNIASIIGGVAVVNYKVNLNTLHAQIKEIHATEDNRFREMNDFIKESNEELLKLFIAELERIK